MNIYGEKCLMKFAEHRKEMDGIKSNLELVLKGKEILV